MTIQLGDNLSAFGMAEQFKGLPMGDLIGLPLKNTAGQGGPLIVYFYPKADTPGCTTEAQDFTRLAPDFARVGATVVGVSRDTPQKLGKFKDKYGLALDLISDADGSICEAFGTWVEKSMYGRSYMGVERSTFLFNSEGTLVAEWRGVKVKGHADAVLEALKAL